MTGALVRQSREHHRPIHHHMASGMQITIGQAVRLLWQAAETEHAHSGRRWMCEGAFWSPLSFRCPEVVGRGWASAGLSLLACRCRNGCHISFDCDRQIGRSTLHSPRFRCPQSRRRPHRGGGVPPLERRGRSPPGDGDIPLSHSCFLFLLSPWHWALRRCSLPLP